MTHGPWGGLSWGRSRLARRKGIPPQRRLFPGLAPPLRPGEAPVPSRNSLRHSEPHPTRTETIGNGTRRFRQTLAAYRILRMPALLSTQSSRRRLGMNPTD